MYGSNAMYGSLVEKYVVQIKRTIRITSANDVRIKNGVQMTCTKHALTIHLVRIRVDKRVLTIRSVR